MEATASALQNIRLENDPKKLALLTYEKNPLIRLEVARNSFTPSLVFDSLMRDTLEIKQALASNPSLVEPYITTLILHNDDQSIIDTLANNIALEEEHLRLIYQRFGYLDGLLINNPRCPEDVIRSSFLVFQNFIVEGHKLEALSGDLFKVFIANPNTPLDILGRIFLLNPKYQKEILESAKIKQPLLENLSDEDLIVSLTRQVKPIY